MEADARQGVADLVEATELDQARQPDLVTTIDCPQGRERGPLTVRVQAVPSEPVTWLWQDKFPIGKISLIVGDPGRGKSLLALDLAARLSVARPWPAGEANPWPPSGTVLLTAEDDVADTIRPRLEAAGADLARVVVFTGAKSGILSKGFQLPRDFDLLAEAIEQAGQVRLLVLDPLVAYLSSAAATNNAAVRAVMATLQDLAQAGHFAVVAISHLTKSPAASPIYRAMGSLGLVAASRAVWSLWPDLDDPKRTYFIPLKCNLSPSLTALAYQIAKHPDIDAPWLVWDPEPIPLTLVSTSTANPLPRVVDQQCIGWLRDLLKDGPLPAGTIDEQAGERGFGRNLVRRAKAALDVHTSLDEYGGKWVCRLP